MIPLDCGTETRDSHRSMSKAQRGTINMLAVACSGSYTRKFLYRDRFHSIPSKFSLERKPVHNVPVTNE